MEVHRHRSQHRTNADCDGPEGGDQLGMPDALACMAEKPEIVQEALTEK